MRIAVCIKQVPAASEGRTDMERGFVMRGGRRRLNPYDGPAVEAALELRARFGGRVDVFSMGPASAAEVVSEALSMGADEGYLLTDKVFAGADSLVTAFTLAEGLRSQGAYDLYIVGQKTTDGDTGQVGPSLAAIMELPFVGRVEKFENLNEDGLFVLHSTDHERQLVRVKGPVFVSVVREMFPPRIPSLKMKMKKKNVHEINFAAFEGWEASHLGSLGSPTKIKRVYFPERPSVSGVRQVNGEEAADLLLTALRGAHGE